MKLSSPHLCLMCGKYEFQELDSFDVYDVCGREDDSIQEDNPDEECCANRMSLNQARKAYANGREVK